jgi:hypothetical protein
MQCRLFSKGVGSTRVYKLILFNSCNNVFTIPEEIWRPRVYHIVEKSINELDTTVPAWIAKNLLFSGWIEIGFHKSPIHVQEYIKRLIISFP